MIYLLIILLIFFLLRRFGDRIMVWLIQRLIKNKFAQAEAAQRRAEEEYMQGRPGGWSAPEPKRKIFDKSDGEYVKFKEIEGERPAPDTTTTTIEVEQQVVDAEWEEVG